MGEPTISHGLMDGGDKTPLEKLEQAKQQRDIAIERYEEAMSFCVRSGIAYRKIAAVAGTTDAAVRMYVKRRGFTSGERRTPVE